MSWAAPAALAALAAALVATLAVEYEALHAEDPTLTPALRPPISNPPPGSAASAAGERTPDWVATILARPMFDPSRRPPRAGSSAAGPGVNGLPRLSGVMVSQAGKKVIFAGQGEGKPIIAEEGSRIGPYTVLSIGVGQVTVAGPNGQQVLRPSFDTATAANPRAAQPAQPAPNGPSILDILRNGPPAGIGVPGLPQFPGAPVGEPPPAAR